MQIKDEDLDRLLAKMMQEAVVTPPDDFSEVLLQRIEGTRQVKKAEIKPILSIPTKMLIVSVLLFGAIVSFFWELVNEPTGGGRLTYFIYSTTRYWVDYLQFDVRFALVFISLFCGGAGLLFLDKYLKKAVLR